MISRNEYTITISISLNLLYRRFSDSENVHQYLKTLAFKLHGQGVTAKDRKFVEGVLKDVYTQEPEESWQVYKRRIQGLFDDIEPRCGLLKFGNGQYSFWYLTFQEFLCADYIRDNRRDQDNLIISYWENKWYREVIRLYIGYVSIENKQTANDIIASEKDWKKASQLPVLRGGGWYVNRDLMRCADRYRDFPYFRLYNVGLRCSRT